MIAVPATWRVAELEARVKAGQIWPRPWHECDHSNVWWNENGTVLTCHDCGMDCT